MRLRLELFVNSVAESAQFYAGVLGFETVRYRPDDYSVIRKGAIQIALQEFDHLPDDHPLKSTGGERLGLGIEIVLEVDDLDALYAQVTASGWPIAAHLAPRPWGSRDFRVIDTNGYYIRLNDPT